MHQKRIIQDYQFLIQCLSIDYVLLGVSGLYSRVSFRIHMLWKCSLSWFLGGRISQKLICVTVLYHQAVLLSSACPSTDTSSCRLRHLFTSLSSGAAGILVVRLLVPSWFVLHMSRYHFVYGWLGFGLWLHNWCSLSGLGFRQTPSSLDAAAAIGPLRWMN